MQQLLKHYQCILNLQNWEIQLIEEENISERGSVNMLYNDYRATIKISKELNDEEKEKSLIHELLHLVHRDELDIAQDNLEQNLSQLYVRYHERSIEQMSKIIYKLCKQIYEEEKITCDRTSYSDKL